MDSSTNSAANHHYALQVALQTMKARCIALQRRLTSVEEENKELREQVEKQATAPPRDALAGSAADNVELRIQVSELQRQMTQLTEHSNMVSNENRKLWSKLSQLSKEQSQQQQAQSNAELDAGGEQSPRGNSSNLNLIRSKTFTQHSPNPQLRHKLISNKVGGGGDAGGSQYDSEDLQDVDVELSQISLDDVNLNDLGEEKQRNGAVEAEEVPYAEAALGFGYLNEAEATVNSVLEAASFGSEFKKMLEGLQAMRQAAQQQQDELYAAINVLECNKECAKLAHKPEMADKSLETDDSLNDVNLLHNQRNSRSSSDYNLSSNVQQNGILKTAGFSQRLNIIEEKIAADASDKTCPMCGKLFAPNVQFREFQEHVEMHFTEDTSDLEHSIERQYEYISHTVGDF